MSVKEVLSFIKHYLIKIYRSFDSKFILKSSLQEIPETPRKELINIFSIFDFPSLAEKSKVLRGAELSYQSILHYSNKSGQKILETSSLKRNGTLFIFGTGASINLLSSQDWKIIKDNVSWGVNMFLLHEQLIDVYFPQIGQKRYKHIFDSIMYEGLSQKALFSKETTFVLRGDWVDNRMLEDSIFAKKLFNLYPDQCYFMPEIPLNEKWKKDFGQTLIDFFEVYKKYQSGKFTFTPKIGNPLNMLLGLALLIGYKKIVLCGVDMESADHFYDNEHYMRLYPSLKNVMLTPVKLQNRFSQAKGIFSRSEQVLSIARVGENYFNAKIYISKPVGALKCKLPAYL
jgi:hypothetical protein